MGKQLKFYYVVSERISEDEFKTQFANELIEAQRNVSEVRSLEIPIYLGVLWNSITMGLRPQPAFDLSDPHMHTLYRVVKRRIEHSLLFSRLAADSRVRLNNLCSDFLLFLIFRPGEAQRLFETLSRNSTTFSSGQLRVHYSYSLETVRKHVDATLVTLCPGQTEKFVKQSQTATEFGFSVRFVTCDASLPITARLRDSIARAKGQLQTPRSLTPGWIPPAQRQHYQEGAAASIRAISGGQFESKRHKY